MDSDLILSSARATLECLLKRLTGSVKTSTIADFVNYTKKLGPFDHYKIFPQKARQLIPDGLLTDGAMASEVFLKAAIMFGMIDMLTSTRFVHLPLRVRAQQIKQLERIIATGDATAEWLHIDRDLFHKEFGIATLRLYVAGAQVVDSRCGIPRSFLFKEGLSKLPKNVAKIVRLGGFRKYFQLHTHDFMLDAFNEEGWSECYICCAELYALYPDALGMYVIGWFCDPILEKISPRLSYLCATPMAAGAELFFVEEGGPAKGFSLSKSPTRRKLYEEGKYFPKSYMLAWSRVKQIAWSENH